MQTILKSMVAAGALMTACAGVAEAKVIQVTVTNVQSSGGFSLTPVYFGFHNGSVDLFDVGAPASAGIAEIAETGMFGPLRGERLAQQANSVGGAAFGPGGAIGGPVEPGEAASFIVNLNGVDNRYAFFASMVLPSNDTFIGVDDPLSIALFDAGGNFLGPQTISVTGAFVYDAGSEANDPANGAAFLQGVDINQGGPGEGVIQQGLSLGDFTSFLLAGGLGLDPLFRNDFAFSNDFVLAEIKF